MSSPRPSPSSDDTPRGDDAPRVEQRALRQPGRKTIRAETSDAGARGMEVEEVIRLDHLSDRGCLGEGVLALVRRLLAEAPSQDITLSQTDGQLVSLRRVLRSRFPR